MPNAEVNDLDHAIPRSLYYYLASPRLYVLRTYKHEDMLIYSKISTLMSLILAVNNDLDIAAPRSSLLAAPRSSLHWIVLLLRHMCGL